MKPLPNMEEYIKEKGYSGIFDSYRTIYKEYISNTDINLTPELNHYTYKASLP